MGAFSLREQIEEVDRELAMRRDVYPRRVSAGRMRASVATYHMARMQAVRDTLQALDEANHDRRGAPATAADR